MKKKILSLFLVILIFVPIFAEATERTFPVGSYILPMDSIYQPSADGGIFEAYGLVYKLLNDGVTIYWIIDQTKTTIDAVDFTVSSTTVNPVVNEYDHANGSSALTGISTSINYSGGPFVVDINDVALTATVIANTLNSADWAAVNIHKSNVTFTANVAREMLGAPPNIALMNSQESLTSGNATILESYLRLSGICSTNYEVLRPTADIVNGNRLDDFDLLWAPHWAGYEKYAAADVENVVTKVATFLDQGNGLFAECASIQVFEHSENGRFLTDYSFGHDGGTQDSTKIHYGHPTEAYDQIGDFTFVPEGGHLHNWRPFEIGDPYENSPIPVNTSSYNNTVKVYTYDDADGVGTTRDFTVTGNDQWDYYVGGRYKGDSNKGYVVYLGGHKYAKCSNNASASESSTPGIHIVEFEFAKDFFSGSEFEFKKDISNETFTFTINYNSGSSLTVTNVQKSAHAVSAEDSNLKVDFTSATFKDKKIKNVLFKKMGSTNVTINSIVVSWSDGHSDQKIKKIKHNGSDIFKLDAGVVSPATCTTSSFTVDNSGEEFTFVVNYNAVFSLSVGPVTTSSYAVSAEDSNLKVDFTSASFNGKKIEDVNFSNVGSSLVTIDSIDITWSGGHGDQKIKKIKDNDSDIFNNGSGLSSVANCTATSFSIEQSSGTATTPDATSCTNNSDCTWTNVAGVRYVLNTLFNLQFDVIDVKYAKSTPIIHNDLMFKGEFKYPSFKGEFNIYDVESTTPTVKWAASTNIPVADERTMFTVLDGDGTVDGIIKTNDPELISFSTANLATNGVTKTLFQDALEMGVPYAGNETLYQDLLNKVRGKDNSTPSAELHKLGGIVHSSPAVVGSFTRNNKNRPTMAYVGTMYGTLHAFKVPGNKMELDNSLASSFKELWSFVTYSQLGSLRHDRTDDPPTPPFPGIDSSPTVAEVYIDHDNNSSTPKQWRTILVSMNGIYGKHSSVYALDITDPDTSIVGQAPSFLWETRGQDHPTTLADNTPPTKVIMGSGYRTTISKLNIDTDSDGLGDTEKYYVFTATNQNNPLTDGNGLNVFAFDLETGDQKWVFSVPYSSQNEVPGALTAADTNADGYIDSLLIGDMDGRVWMIDAETGANPFGTEDVQASLSKNPIIRAWDYLFGVKNAYAALMEIPLFNGGAGTDNVNAGIGYPVSGSISLARSSSGATLAYFGTGGADWANLSIADNNHVYAVDLTNIRPDKSYSHGAGTVEWEFELDDGEKVWGAVTIANSNIYFGTVFGTVESIDPSDDICVAGSSCGNIRSINRETGNQSFKIAADGKIRSSVFMKKGHLYATLNNGKVQQFGDGTFTDDKNVQQLNWKEN